MGMKKFIVIESLDHEVKSRVIDRVKKDNEFNFYSTKKVPKSDLPWISEMYKVKELMWPQNDNEIGKMLSINHWLRVQSLWYELMYKVFSSTDIDANVITDGWYYKFLAKIGIDKSRCFDSDMGFFKHIGTPSQVVLIEIDDFDEYWNKQIDLKPSKFGVHQGFKSESKQTFIKYHKEIQNELIEIGKKNNWIIVENSYSIDEILKKLEI